MSAPPTAKAEWTREDMARLVAADIAAGAYVNLGIGIPELVARFVPAGREVIFHTENGLLGMGPPPAAGAEDPELINAGKRTVTAIPGAAYFHHADSFAMIRGGHLDVSVLGAFQVSEHGDLANWSTGEADVIPAVGGAMDLVAGVKQVFVMTEHTTKSGEPKIVRSCTYPLTGRGVVNRIYTNLAVIDVTPNGLVIRELPPGVTLGEVQAKTGAPLNDGRSDSPCSTECMSRPPTPHPAIGHPLPVQRGEGRGEGQPAVDAEKISHSPANHPQ